MKTVQLSGSLRASVGKKATKALRNEGQVPCVLYGTGEQTHFSVRSVDVEKLIFTPNVYQIELNIDGTKKLAILQDKQMDPIKDNPLHVDFLELVAGKPVKMGVPIRFVGRSKGVLNGGNLVTIFRRLNIEGLPKDIPDEAEIDISPLKIGDAIRIRDIKIDGVRTLEAPGAVIVSVKNARGAIEDEVDEEEEGEEGTEGEESTEGEEKSEEKTEE